MGAIMLLGRACVVPLFIDDATAAVNAAAYGYLFVVVPFYPLLGLLCIYRSALQSMDDARTPFAACVSELVMRVTAAFVLARFFATRGYASRRRSRGWARSPSSRRSGCAVRSGSRTAARSSKARFAVFCGFFARAKTRGRGTDAAPRAC